MAQGFISGDVLPAFVRQRIGWLAPESTTYDVSLVQDLQDATDPHNAYSLDLCTSSQQRHEKYAGVWYQFHTQWGRAVFEPYDRSLVDRLGTLKCSKPVAPINGGISVAESAEDGGGLGCTVSFRCDPGFELWGPHELKCVCSVTQPGTAIWDKEAPVCKKKCESHQPCSSFGGVCPVHGTDTAWGAVGYACQWFY